MLLPFPGERNVRGPLDLLRRVWRDTLAQPDPGDLAAKAKRALSVPFVDYARGDGLTVGPGGDVEWTPQIISDQDGWVDRYQGLWGLDTGDRFAGERAPAGPKYTRTGSVRQSWHDPLGFAGLAKVPPPSQAVPVLEERIAELEATLERGDSRGRGTGGGAPEARPGDSGDPRHPRSRDLPCRPPGRLAHGRGQADKPPHPGGRAANRHRGEPRTAGRPGRRPAGRPAHPSPPRLGTGAAGGREPSCLRRGVGGAQRRTPHRGPGRHRLVPHPAGPDGDRRPARVVSRDRIVLRSEHWRARAEGHRRAGSHLVAHPRGDLRA